MYAQWCSQLDRNRECALYRHGLRSSAPVAAHCFRDELPGKPQQGCYVVPIGELQKLSAVGLGHAGLAWIQAAPQRTQPLQVSGICFDPMSADINEQQGEIVEVARFASSQA